MLTYKDGAWVCSLCYRSQQFPTGKTFKHACNGKLHTVDAEGNQSERDHVQTQRQVLGKSQPEKPTTIVVPRLRNTKTAATPRTSGCGGCGGKTGPARLPRNPDTQPEQGGDQGGGSQ